MLEKCGSQMQEQRVIRRRGTNGISCGSIKERAETERVHPATLHVCRYDRLVSTTWSVTSKPGRKEKMSTKDALGLSSSIRPLRFVIRRWQEGQRAQLSWFLIPYSYLFFPAVLPHLMVETEVLTALHSVRSTLGSYQHSCTPCGC